MFETSVRNAPNANNGSRRSIARKPNDSNDFDTQKGLTGLSYSVYLMLRSASGLGAS